MNNCKQSPSGRHAIEQVFVSTCDEHTVSLEFTCLFCDVRGSVFTFRSDQVDWDDEEDDEDEDV